MLKGFCQKRYHSMMISNVPQENQKGGQVQGFETPGQAQGLAPQPVFEQPVQNVALDGVSAILSKLVSQAETRFLGAIRSLGDSDAGALNAAQLLKVQMDVTLNNTTTSMSSSILAAIGSMLRGISNNIHA